MSQQHPISYSDLRFAYKYGLNPHQIPQLGNRIPELLGAMRADRSLQRRAWFMQMLFVYMLLFFIVAINTIVCPIN